jgi:hypothetical protein
LVVLLAEGWLRLRCLHNSFNLFWSYPNIVLPWVSYWQ